MNKRSVATVNLILLFVCAAVFLLCLRFGSADITWRSLFRKDSSAALIIRAVRLPRTVAACVAGCALSMSGVLLQSAVDNPLAGPNIIGVNSGAGLGMVLAMSFFPKAVELQPWAAFFGAFLCTIIVAGIAKSVNRGRTAVVLAGVAVSALMNAGISALKLLFPDIAMSYTYFAIGGFSGVTLDKLWLPMGAVAVCFAAAYIMSSRLDLLCLGESYAASLGVRISRVRFGALILASVSAGAAVSFGGLIGFVGLMVPHMARRIAGGRIKSLLPAACLLGMILMMVSDLVGRVIFAPGEVPAGMITAVLGVPFFLFLLKRRDIR